MRCARNIRDMTTLMFVDGQQGETRTQAITRRLRMEFARLRVSDSEAARRAGITQDKMSRRMTGKTPFDVDDLDQICEALGISFDYVTTGIRALPPTPPTDGPGLQLPRLDSNQEPAGGWLDIDLPAAAGM